MNPFYGDTFSPDPSNRVLLVAFSWVFHSWGSDNLPRSWFQISQCMLLKQFSNDLPTTEDKFILSSFHLLLPDSCINHDLSLRTGNLCAPIRWEDVFNCYPGRWRTDMEAHALFRTPCISLPVLLLLAGLFLQVKKSRMTTATVPQHLSELLLLFCSHHSRYPHPPCTWPLFTVI